MKPGSIRRAEVSAAPASRPHFKWIALAAGAVCVVTWAALDSKPTVQPAPAPIKLKAVQVTLGTVEQVITARGKLQLHKYADVNAQIPGHIDDVKVSVGDEVKAGRQLLTIKPVQSAAKQENHQAQLARLRAELAEQKAQLDFAELQYKRQTQLKAENATREESFEASRAAWFAASARVDAINARVRQTELAIGEEQALSKHADVTAPISGTIVAMQARVGQAVNAGPQSQPLMRIADMSKLTVQARVAEEDVPRVQKGMTARFTTPGYPGKYWSGKVRQIIPIPAEGSGELGKETFYNVLFDVANPERRLMSGMSAQVEFVLARAEQVPKLPRSILEKANDKGEYTVTVLGADRRPQPRTIRVGIQGGDQVQVLSGLASGESVVLSAPVLITEGSRNPLNSDSAASPLVGAAKQHAN
jgi:macrolide-specific efflux system membrane fusion protein